MGRDRLRVIESQQNPQFKLWDSLQDSRGIRKHRRFLLSGRKAVPEALARYSRCFGAILIDDEAAIAGWDIPDHVEPYRLAPGLFNRLDVSGTGFPLLVGTVPDFPLLDLATPPRGLELICALGDPNNLGALLRSAAAFGVSRMILLEEAAHPYHPKCLRAAANAQFELEICRGGRWSDVKGASGPMVALDADGHDIVAFDWPRDLRLILGEEGQGLPADLPVRTLAIPTTRAVESLNATVAASLALFAAYASRR